MRSLAAFDLDPHAPDPLAFGARTYLRLRVGYGGAFTRVREDSGDSGARAQASSVRAIMQTAQDEAFEEELFAEVRAESTTPARARPR
jgi:hypothetical protein